MAEPIYSALGQLAINWNFAEGWIRTLAGSYLGQGKRAIGEIFTVELGSVGLQNVLCSIAKHCPMENEAQSLEDCAEYYERLREYRNYYLHGTILAVDYEDERPPAGFTYTKSAKGQIKTYAARVEAAQILAVADQCQQVGLHARQIFYHLHGNKNEGGAKPPLPDKPLLPPRLDKSRPYPQSQPPRPQS